MKWFMSCLLLVSLTACTTSMDVYTKPPNARVYLDGEYVGESPCTIHFNFRRSSIDLRVEKKGYIPYEGTLHKRAYWVRQTPSYQVSNPDEPAIYLKGYWAPEVLIELDKREEAQP